MMQQILFNEKYPDVNITIDAGGSGEGLKQVSEGTVNIGNSDVEAAEKLDASKASAACRPSRYVLLQWHLS